jgi:hypothetical protein
MMEVTLHPMPRWRDVVLEQIRIIGLSLRPVGLVVGVVLAIGTVVIVGEIIGGGPGFDSRETFPTAFIAFLYPFAVWRGEKRFGPSFLWTLPVDRRRLALAKVFAGLVWLMAALAFFISWLVALGLLAGVSPAWTILRVPLPLTIFMYLIGSALVVGLRYPLRWLCGAAGVVFLLGGVSQALERYSGVNSLLGSRSLFSATEQAGRIWQTLPPLAQWAIAAVVLWIPGLVALWVAASRHLERRRH